MRITTGAKRTSLPMAKVLKITISGQVQGVFFRAKTKSHADRMGLKGTVCNLKDGSVEICLQGTREEAERLVEAMQGEPPPIQIAQVMIEEASFSQSYSDFRVIEGT